MPEFDLRRKPHCKGYFLAGDYFRSGKKSPGKGENKLPRKTFGILRKRNSSNAWIWQKCHGKTENPHDGK